MWQGKDVAHLLMEMWINVQKKCKAEKNTQYQRMTVACAGIVFYHQAFPWFSLRLCNHTKATKALEMKPQPERRGALRAPICCIRVWKISSPSALVRSHYEKSHFPKYLSRQPSRAIIGCSPPPLCSDTIDPGRNPLCQPGAYTPRPARTHTPIQHQHIWLVYHSGYALFWCPGHGYLGRVLVTCRGQAWGQSFPRLWARRLVTHGNTEGRGIIERENERERGKLCSHFLSFIYSRSFSPTVPWKPLVRSAPLSPSYQFLLNWIAGGEIANNSGREQCNVIFIFSSQIFHLFPIWSKRNRKILPNTLPDHRKPQTIRKCKSAPV